MVRELRLLPAPVPVLLLLLCLFPLFRTREAVGMVGMMVGRAEFFLGGLRLRPVGMMVGVGTLEGLVSREKLLVRGTVVDVIIPMLVLAVEPRLGPGSGSLIWWSCCCWGCGCGCGCCGCCCW